MRSAARAAWSCSSSATIIERLLADPRRIIAVRTNMNLGQTVRILDWRDGQMRNGKVVAMKDTQVTLHEEGTRREWKLPYAAVEPPLATAQPTAAAAPATPPPLKASRNDFRGGEKVSFDDKYLQPQVGTVVRINQERPRSTRETANRGACRSTCFATCSTSERRLDQTEVAVKRVLSRRLRAAGPTLAVVCDHGIHCGRDESKVMVAVRHLSRAPIAEAAINFRVRAGSDAFGAEDLQRLSRDFGEKFPTGSRIENNAVKLHLEGASAPKTQHTATFGGYRFSSADQHKVCVLEPNGFLFSYVNAYTDWNSLVNDARFAWEEYVSLRGEVEILRIGLRYINRLRFDEPVELNDYLTTSPQIPADLPQRAASFLSRVVMPIPELGETAGAVLSHALQTSDDSENYYVVLDVDVFSKDCKNVRADQVFDTLGAFRDWKNRIFFAAITEKTVEKYI